MKPARFPERAFCFACLLVSFHLLKLIVGFDVLSCILQFEARMVAASFARRKFLAVNACHFMLLYMLGVVRDDIDAGMRHRIAGLKDIPDICHCCVPLSGG